MRDRLFGIETEYAMVQSAPEAAGTEPGDLSRLVLERAARTLVHLRDGAGAGMFLANGGRLYVDCGCHPEYATPETDHPTEAVRQILAGDQILAGLAVDPADRCRMSFFKTNVDYRRPAVTWGCHESILTSSSTGRLADNLVPFLVSRIVYTGAGGFDPGAPGLRFTLSPRAAHLKRVRSSDSTGNRGIFHTKKESLCGHGYQRLHLLCGESLRSQAAMWLRTAATVLVVALVDGGVDPGCGVALQDPIGALRRIASDDTCRACVLMADGSRATAIEIQRRYLACAERHARAGFMPRWAEQACDRWREALDSLEATPRSGADAFDWTIKRTLYEDRLWRRGFTWSAVAAWSDVLHELRVRAARAGLSGSAITVQTVLDPPEILREPARHARIMADSLGLDWTRLGEFAALRLELFEVDVRFGEIGPDTLFDRLDRAGVLHHRVDGVDRIADAIQQPPEVGRAAARGRAVRMLAPAGWRYRCDWHGIRDLTTGRTLDLSDPFARLPSWVAPIVGAGVSGAGTVPFRRLAGSVRRSPLRRVAAALAWGVRAVMTLGVFMASHEALSSVLEAHRAPVIAFLHAGRLDGGFPLACQALGRSEVLLAALAGAAVMLHVRLHWSVLAALASWPCLAWWWRECSRPFWGASCDPTALVLLPAIPVPILLAVLAARSIRRRVFRRGPIDRWSAGASEECS